MIRILTFITLFTLMFSCAKASGHPPANALKTSEAPLTPAPSPPDAGFKEVRFVAIGDTGKGNDGQYQVGKSIGAHCAAQGCDFVVLLGDNFYPSGVSSVSDPLWESAFVKPYAPVDAPFYAVLGNHDCGGNGSGTEFAKGDVQIDYAKMNPKWRMPARHYHWRLGDVEFFVGDTNRSMFGLDGDARAAFGTWLPSSTARWKIAFGHHPLRSNGPHGNAGSYDGLPYVPIANGSGVKRFVEELVCGRADVYLSGHDHNIQWLTEPCSRPNTALKTELIVSGGGARTTPLVGKNPTHYQSGDLGFVYVVISENALTASFYDVDGKQQHSRTISK